MAWQWLFAQKRDLMDDLRRVWRNWPEHGNVSTLPVISKAVRRVCLIYLTTPLFVSVILTLAAKKVAAKLFRSHPTFLSARTALRFTALQTSHVYMGNASFTAASKDTSPRPTAIAASANTLNSLTRRTYPQVPTDSNTFPSEGTEMS